MLLYRPQSSVLSLSGIKIWSSERGCLFGILRCDTEDGTQDIQDTQVLKCSLFHIAAFSGASQYYIKN